MTKITKTIAAPATAKVTQTAQATGFNSTSAPKPEVAAADGVYDEAMRRYNEARDYLLGAMKAPTWKRTLLAFLTTVVVGFGIGFIAGTLLDWLVVGALTMAVPLFLTMVVYVIGACLAIYYGGKFAARIGGAVLTGEADEKALAAYDAVKGVLSKLNPFAKATIEAA